MSSPSKKRRSPSPDPMREADTHAAAVLAADADAATPINHTGWRDRALGTDPVQALADRPQMRWTQVRMGVQLAGLCAKYARDDDLSREGWMRLTLAREVSRRSGIDVDTLLAGIVGDKPRRTRHDHH